MITWRQVRQTWHIEKSNLWPLIITVVAGALFGALVLERHVPSSEPTTKPALTESVPLNLVERSPRGSAGDTVVK